ncbi:MULTISPECIES: PqqD family protein [Micrococcaceae]|uniref:PqqD family protein n=1 Tax=Micrococcaceae TaxID=1268 RepID=UPI0027DD685F|nr:PqqD family protein [Arthrobacter sp. PvP023]
MVLEGSAAAVWLLIDGVRTQAEMVAELVYTFGEADERMATHVDTFLSQLAAQQLIEAVGQAFVEPDAHRGSTSNAG